MRMEMLFGLLLLLPLLAGCPAASPADTPPSATVTLTWSGAADLDLEIWSDTGAYLGDANDWQTGPEGENREEFTFRAYNAAEDLRGGKGSHFEQGAYNIATTAWHAEQPCTATISIYTADEKVQSLTRQLDATENLVWFAMRWDNAAGTASVIDTVVHLPPQ